MLIAKIERKKYESVESFQNFENWIWKLKIKKKKNAKNKILV